MMTCWRLWFSLLVLCCWQDFGGRRREERGTQKAVPFVAYLIRHNLRQTTRLAGAAISFREKSPGSSGHFYPRSIIQQIQYRQTVRSEIFSPYQWNYRTFSYCLLFCSGYWRVTKRSLFSIYLHSAGFPTILMRWSLMFSLFYYFDILFWLFSCFIWFAARSCFWRA